jgi:Polyketide cyclase / dehydrase and lipid transport
MRVTSAIAAIVALVLSAVSALALDSSITVSSPLSPDALWEKVGDFCGISLWNPAVEKCDLSADGKQRTVSFFGVSFTLVARLDHWDEANRSYTFTSLSGILPIVNYHASVSVIGNANGSALKWSATYDAKGVPDTEAKKAVDAATYRTLCFQQSSPMLPGSTIHRTCRVSEI